MLEIRQNIFRNNRTAAIRKFFALPLQLSISYASAYSQRFSADFSTSMKSWEQHTRRCNYYTMQQQQ